MTFNVVMTILRQFLKPITSYWLKLDQYRHSAVKSDELSYRRDSGRLLEQLQSRGKDGGQAVKSAIVENLVLGANTMMP